MDRNYFKYVLFIGAALTIQIYTSCSDDCRRIVDSPPGTVLVVTRVENSDSQSGSVYKINLKIPSEIPNKKPTLKKLSVTKENLFEYSIDLGFIEEGDSLKRTLSGSWARFYD